MITRQTALLLAGQVHYWLVAGGADPSLRRCNSARASAYAHSAAIVLDGTIFTEALIDSAFIDAVLDGRQASDFTADEFARLLVEAIESP